MNRAPINASPINGAGLAASVVSAVAAIVCAATLIAVGTRQQDALAPTYSGANVVADAHIARMATASVWAFGDLAPNASHVQFAHANMPVTANLQAFVLREVNSSASTHGTAELVAIPAGILADADLAGSVAVLADATKVQPGKALIDTSGEISPISTALVTRYVQADLIGGGAEIRVETTIDDVSEAYSALHATAELSINGAGLVTKYGLAALGGSASTNADATQIQPGRAHGLGAGLLLVANPHIEQLPAIFMGAQASISVEATRVLNSGALIAAGASIKANCSQQHGSPRSELAGNAQLMVVGLASRNAGGATIQAGVALQAQALRTLLPQAHASCQAGMAPAATRVMFADPLLLASHAGLVAQADQTVRAGVAQMGGDAQVTGVPLRTAYVSVLVSGQAGLDAVLDRTTYGFVDITCAASIEADTRMNLASFDPPSRTFYRPAIQTEFSRPAQQTEFRRVA